jgi:hypothetical protein
MAHGVSISDLLVLPVTFNSMGYYKDINENGAFLTDDESKPGETG